MNVRAKFDGGKQYNRSQRGSWGGRCAGAGLRQNIGPEWGKVVWEEATGKEANPVFSRAVVTYNHQLDKDRKRKSSDDAKKKRKNKKYCRTNDNSLRAYNDYQHDGGPDVADVPHDLPGDFLATMLMEYYKANVQVSAEKLADIQIATRDQNAGDEAASNLWKVERRKRLAS